jgi:hypothetical protein
MAPPGHLIARVGPSLLSKSMVRHIVNTDSMNRLASVGSARPQRPRKAAPIMTDGYWWTWAGLPLNNSPASPPRTFRCIAVWRITSSDFAEPEVCFPAIIERHASLS